MGINEELIKMVDEQATFIIGVVNGESARTQVNGNTVLSITLLGSLVYQIKEESGLSIEKICELIREIAEDG